MVDNEVHGRMTPEQVPVLLAKYRAKSAEKKVAG
jgi:NADH:ubiquinone oxidoreductase subunit E